MIEFLHELEFILLKEGYYKEATKLKRLREYLVKLTTDCEKVCECGKPAEDAGECYSCADQRADRGE